MDGPECGRTDIQTNGRTYRRLDAKTYNHKLNRAYIHMPMLLALKVSKDRHHRVRDKNKSLCASQVKKKKTRVIIDLDVDLSQYL